MEPRCTCPYEKSGLADIPRYRAVFWATIGSLGLGARMGRIVPYRDLLGIGAPDDRQFALFHSVGEPGRVRRDLPGGRRHDALLCRAVRAAQRDADATGRVIFCSS